MKRSDINREKLSPMMRQYVELKDNYEDCIIFFRLGDFYEMFFEDALLCSKTLELTLTGKQAGLEEKIPMCGIPHHSHQNYINTLVNDGYKVAIVEQLENASEVKGMVKRDVVQIITKGTKIDTTLDSKTNNYIAAISHDDYCYSLAYTDITTGDVYATLIDNDDDAIIKEILRNDIFEVVAHDNVQRELIEKLRSSHHILVTISKDLKTEEKYDYIYKNIEDNKIINVLKLLLKYILDAKKGDLLHLQECNIIKSSEFLKFDNNTKRNLELIETLKNREKQYSLLWFLDKCKTALGSRFLKYNIENPLTSKDEIIKRYNLVEKLSTEFIIRDELIKSLEKVYDLERLIGRISYGNLNARDLLQLKQSLFNLPEINDKLVKLKFDKELILLEDLYSLLEKTINENAPLTLHEGNLIKPGYNKELDELKDISSGSKDFILELEQKEKERTGIKNLKVGFNKVFGYFIEVSKGQKHLIKDEFGYDRKQTLANCERFITEELKEKENIILSAEEKITKLEYNLFMNIKEVVKRYIEDIQKNAKIIAEVDMLQAFSKLTDEQKLIKPNLIDTNNVKLIDCRHPVVEAVTKEKYVANDIVMDQTIDILLITGPNMAGKSTYMRQFAITVIMAQIGCFVPCKSAQLPIFDKIFTRIGASDDLVSGESTFMVEMKEASIALKDATNNSLILFDELGRGTATYDGMSLAQSILEYIHNNLNCKTMFSTHYHELTDLSKTLKSLKNVHVSAIEEKGNITFLHKVKNGPVDKSYGIHVAQLAKLPNQVIKRADEILSLYETKSKKEKTDYVQLDLFKENNQKENTNEVLERLKNINILELNPLQAINTLNELINDAKKDK